MSIWVGVAALVVLCTLEARARHRERQQQAWHAKWSERNTILPSGRSMVVVEPANLDWDRIEAERDAKALSALAEDLEVARLDEWWSLPEAPNPRWLA